MQVDKTNKYEYLLKDGALVYTKNGSDKYVEICTESGKYMIPISMPRRMPDLIIDIDPPRDELWEYLSNCESILNKKDVDLWVTNEISKLKVKKSETDTLLFHLLKEFNICYYCFSKNTPIPIHKKTYKIFVIADILYVHTNGFVQNANKSKQCILLHLFSHVVSSHMRQSQRN